MEKPNKIKLIQLLILLIGYILILYFFGGDEYVNGQEIEHESYQPVSDHRIARYFKHDICTDADDPEQNFITARVTAYAPFDNKSGICNDGDPTAPAQAKDQARNMQLPIQRDCLMEPSSTYQAMASSRSRTQAGRLGITKGLQSIYILRPMRKLCSGACSIWKLKYWR